MTIRPIYGHIIYKPHKCFLLHVLDHDIIVAKQHFQYEPNQLHDLIVNSNNIYISITVHTVSYSESYLWQIVNVTVHFSNHALYTKEFVLMFTLAYSGYTCYVVQLFFLHTIFSVRPGQRAGH